MGSRGSAYYKVDIQSLGIGDHKFEFDIDSTFFENFENSPVSKGNLVCELTLDVNERLIVGQFEIKGEVELTCDNSLELFDHPLEFEKEVLFKYGDELMELDETTIQIPRNIDQLNVGELIFEFVVLELPMRKIHPKYAEENSDGVFFSTEGSSEETDTNESIDPRWSALKDLKK